MARILLVEDDRDQRELRRMLLQHFGHDVDGCTMPIEAEAACATQKPDVVVMDLRLPNAKDGLSLVRALRARHPQLPIIVVTGWADDLEGTPERDSVQAVLRKPVQSGELVKLISQFVVKSLTLLMLLCGSIQAQVLKFPFEWAGDGEAVASLTLAAPDSDWSVAGREGSVAEIRVGSGAPHHIVVASGSLPVEHRVFLGPLAAGRHTLIVDRLTGGRLTAVRPSVTRLDPQSPAGLAVLHAPVLFARTNTIGAYSDIPLFAYATTGVEGAQRWFEYTIVFSNEDGGTSTRNLMARWGRAADIEYVYKVWLDQRGARVRTQIQTTGHKDVPYDGPFESQHPLLVPVTQNNMVDPAIPAKQSAWRFQFAPDLVDLSGGARELTMDARPWSYQVVAAELLREGKIRPPLTHRQEDIADPRNYMVVEYRATLRNAGLQVLIRRRGERDWYASALGIPENFIERNGWARTALELPPGTRRAQLAEIAFQCLLLRDNRVRPAPISGECRIEAIGKLFLTQADATPGPALQFDGFGTFSELRLPTGGMRAFSFE